MFILANGSSSLKTRILNCRLLNNFEGFRLSSAASSQLAARIQGNNSSSYRLLQSGAGTFQVENFGSFASENTGPLTTVGTILDATLDSLGIPF